MGTPINRYSCCDANITLTLLHPYSITHKKTWHWTKY